MGEVELARLVKRMREAPRLYFKGRGSDDLETSKVLERQVDKAVAEVLEPPGLFPEDGAESRG